MSEVIDLNKVFVQGISSEQLSAKSIEMSVLRIDALHPVISGNKWFKLKYHLEDAIGKGFHTIATFGGAYSNHIAATAFACKQFGLKSAGFIRGEKVAELSHTLIDAEKNGMDLLFVSRKEFGNIEEIKEMYSKQNWYWVNTGGYSSLGAKGAAEMYHWIDDSYTHILCAAGTGTMMAGLINAAKKHQTVIGINSMKNERLINDIQCLLSEKGLENKYSLINDYHFGGFAKHPKPLIEFMKKNWNEHQLPTDIVYTAKLLFACFDLIEKDFFPAHSKLMVIHSGGLQGNLSLPHNSLPF